MAPRQGESKQWRYVAALGPIDGGRAAAPQPIAQNVVRNATKSAAHRPDFGWEKAGVRGGTVCPMARF